MIKRNRPLLSLVSLEKYVVVVDLDDVNTCCHSEEPSDEESVFRSKIPLQARNDNSINVSFFIFYVVQ
ncbi:MAG: hypothetical protein PHY91_07090 [Tissierellia bacterium]|nr:hypothetical protein [Tissierellia bacterium]